MSDLTLARTSGHSVKKDARIEELLAWLREKLGDRFRVTDHWDADSEAVGISTSDAPWRLVYIRVHGRPAGLYDVRPEPPDLSRPDPSSPSQSAQLPVTREELLDIAVRHLQ
jgi:hypothetical protein